MRVEIVKKKDGGGVLRCTRADGSVTWQKQTDRHAIHFAFHDLTHLSVESVMGYRDAFFGLVAQGWEIEDTTGKGSRGPIPEEALRAESVIGAMDAERAAGVYWTMQEFAEYCPVAVTEEQITRIRALRARLFAAWIAVEPGGALQTEFPAPEK